MSLTEGDVSITDDNEKPLAVWEAAFLPDWKWEAYESEDDGLYYGRVKSPLTHGDWERGYFTEEQLRTAGAYRTDTELDEDGELFPDGGSVGVPVQVKLYETELESLLEDRGETDVRVPDR